jgi:hypothetical protein
MKWKLLERVLLWGVLIALTSYALDYLSLRLAIRGHRNIYGQVQIEHYYAVHEKNGKIEFMFQNPEMKTCVHSLFAHFGYDPCWYVSRHNEHRVDI